VKLIPIIALVTEETLEALTADVAEAPPCDDLRPLMEANGWTVEAITAGYIIGRAYE